MIKYNLKQPEDLETVELRGKFYRMKPCNRQEYIMNFCKGKRVLDIGCTCWPNTQLRMKHETLLHERLLKIASIVHGIDIDRDGIKYMREVRGYTGVFCINATDLQGSHPELLDTYDVIVLGDIVEHVTNPQDVITAAASRLGRDGQLIVTLPNAFHLYGFVKALLGSECTHPDHVAFYSPMNIQELCRRCNLKLLEMRGYYEDSYKEHFLKRALRNVERLGMRFFPGTSCGIIFRATK